MTAGEKEEALEPSEIEKEIGRTLRAANVQPETAQKYLETLDRWIGREEYIERYRKRLTPKSYHFLGNLVDVKEGSRILDIGCGVNAPLYEVFRDLDFDYVGADAVPEIIEENRETYPDAEFVEAVVPYEMDKIRGKYDQVVAGLFFDALNKPETALTLVRTNDLLCQGGEVTVTLSKARKEKARFVADSLKSMGYNFGKVFPHGCTYRYKLKEGEIKDRETLYVVQAEKDSDTNFTYLEDDLECCCRLRGMEVDELEGRSLKKPVNDLKTMERENKFPDHAWQSLQSTEIEKPGLAFHVYNQLQNGHEVGLGRPTSEEENKRIVDWIQDELPEVSVYPGENEKGFKDYTVEP